MLDILTEQLATYLSTAVLVSLHVLQYTVQGCNENIYRSDGRRKAVCAKVP